MTQISFPLPVSLHTSGFALCCDVPTLENVQLAFRKPIDVTVLFDVKRAVENLYCLMFVLSSRTEIATCESSGQWVVVSFITIWRIFKKKATTMLLDSVFLVPNIAAITTFLTTLESYRFRDNNRNSWIDLHLFSN